jgi:hypothetical protein
MSTSDTSALSEEDAKLVTLARGARGRIGAPCGAALRDDTGRTYAAADVALPSLTLSALQLVVAQAVASGSRGVEAAVVVGMPSADRDGLRALADLGGTGVVVHVCDTDGRVVSSTIAGT